MPHFSSATFLTTRLFVFRRANDKLSLLAKASLPRGHGPLLLPRACSRMYKLLLYFVLGLFADLPDALPIIDAQETVPRMRWDVTCAPAPQPIPECSPVKCGRVVRDDMWTQAEVLQLRALCENAMQYGGGSGGPTIYDLASGALSRDNAFIDVYYVLRASGMDSPLTDGDRKLLMVRVHGISFAYVPMRL